jgi:hypothetical protein
VHVMMGHTQPPGWQALCLCIVVLLHPQEMVQEHNAAEEQSLLVSCIPVELRAHAALSYRMVNVFSALHGSVC